MSNNDWQRRADDLPAASAGSPVVVPVSLLVSNARLLIERHLGLTWVSGEISNFTRAASGHCYFNLKDAQAQVRCVLFRMRAQAVPFALRDGLAVEIRATPSIYEARGEFQLNVDNVRLAGIGALYERFERLKAKLETAGWFAEERKRPVPAFPRAIGLVTSPQAAALRDLLTTLRRRWPAVRVILYPAAVQGAGAAAEIAAAIRIANERREVDTLIVARGGGSIEDLWSFNEEIVAQAVFESALPVISGVGHETDFTICDFVADLRAPTPTGAAAHAVPDRVAVGQRVGALARGLARAGTHALELRAQRLDHASRRLTHPATRLAQQAERTRDLACRLVRLMRADMAARRSEVGGARIRFCRELRAPLPAAARLAVATERWRRAGPERVAVAQRAAERLAQSLAHLNPQAVLERGFAIVATADGRIVRDGATLQAGDPLRLTLARGSAEVSVERASGARDD